MNQRNRARHHLGLILLLAISMIGTVLPLASTIAASVRQSGSGLISSASSQENPLSLNRWSSNGPEGGTVLSIAIDRSNPATIYAGTPTGVFKSTNGGESWSSSLTNVYVQIVAIAPTTPTTLYAAGHSGIYKSTDGGTSWKAINNGLENQYGPVYVLALAIDPTNSNIIYAAGPDITDSSGTYKAIYKSTDGGGTWSITKHSIRSYAIHRTLAIDPINTNIIYAAGSVGNGTVWKSTDNGKIWSIVNVGLDSRSTVYALAIDPTNPNIIYVGTETLGVYKSSDGGGSWSPFSDGLDYYYVDDNGQRNFFRVSSIVIDPINPSIVYAGTYHGAYKSGGGSWSALVTGINLGVNALAMDPGNTNIMYTGTDRGVLRSSSGGASWSTINKGLPGINVSSLALDTENADVYAGTDDGTFSSTDNGGNWSLRDFYPLAFDPRNPNTIYARRDGNDGLFKSTNGGAAWGSANAGLENTYVSAVKIDPSNSEVIYVASDLVFRSTNGGASWSAISDLYLSYPSLLAIDPSNSQTIYAAAYDYYYDSSSVFKSTDGGVHWNKADSGANFYYVSALVIDPINTATIYVSAYTYDASGLFKSTDGGASWSRINTGLPSSCAPYACEASSLAIDPINSNVIYAGTYGDGVLKSTDGGVSWNPLNQGLTSLNINALAIDASGTFLHAGTPAGVFDIQLSVPPPPNQIDDAQFFVRQHYADFLNREPDPGGLAYWMDRITQCGSDASCIHERRIGVSAAFFIELEFQDTGYYVYRFYKASFGRQPNYAEFTSDRSKVKVVDGSSLEANKQAFADEWVQRTAFAQAYPITMSNTEVVNKLFDTAGLTGSTYDLQRQQEIAAMNSGRSRALVLRDVIEIPDFKSTPDPNSQRYAEVKRVSQYNPAFVLMQYFGYLRRNVDQSGYDHWLDVLNNRAPNNYHAMVCAFLTSEEYQLRFGASVTRMNQDCAQ